MSTREQIRNQVYAFLKETESNSNFTPNQINEYINQGQRYLGTLLEFPRDLVSIPGDSLAETYTLPDDFLFMRYALFGDTTIKGDSLPLRIVTDKTLGFIFPNFLENTDNTRGRPEYLAIMDQTSFMVFPKVDATRNGKPITFSYCFIPRPMSVDTDEPQLPVSVHDALQFYAAHLCYITMQMPDKAADFLRKFNEYWKSVESQSTKESDSGMQFEWQYSADL